MTISELKQKLLLYELSQLGYRDAVYDAADGIIKLEPDDDRSPKICGGGEITYASEHGDFVRDTLWPAVAGINEAVAAWERSMPIPIDELSRFRVLAEYNRVVLAARDDTDAGRGFHYVTWQYNPERTGVSHGHYTDNYMAAKEDFAVRSGLVSEMKLFTPEQAAELKASVRYRILSDAKITYEEEGGLAALAEQLNDAYPEVKTVKDTPDASLSPRAPQASLAKGGVIQPGDFVIAADNNDYRYLIGMVTDIDKLGTSAHGTPNKTDDVHVDFLAFDYTPERIIEIEDYFCDLHGELRAIDNLALDDVIMAPEMLIRITHLGHDEIARMGNLRENCEAFCNCFPGAVEPQNDKHGSLLARLEGNITDYYNMLMGADKRGLIDMAAKIAAMSDAYSYLCSYDYSDDELDYLLKFQNPLAVVADEWYRRTDDLSDMSFALDEVFEKQDALNGGYALMPAPTAAPAETINPSEKPKSLSGKLRAADEKVKAQNTQKTKMSSPNREER